MDRSIIPWTAGPFAYVGCATEVISVNGVSGDAQAMVREIKVGVPGHKEKVGPKEGFAGVFQWVFPLLYIQMPNDSSKGRTCARTLVI